MQIVTSALSKVTGMVFGSGQQEPLLQGQSEAQVDIMPKHRQEQMAETPTTSMFQSQPHKEAIAPRQRSESMRTVPAVTYNYPSSHPPAAAILSDVRRRDERNLDKHRNSSERRALREQVRALEESTRELDNKLEDARAAIHSRDKHIMALENQLSQQAKVLSRVEEEKVQISELLEVRTAELKAAQAFLTTADKLSGNEVISKVQSLNSEVLQAAAQASEPPPYRKIDGRPKFSDYIVRSLGRTNISLLESRLVQGSDDADHLVQVFLQHVLLDWSTTVISSWNVWNKEFSSSLDRIYDDIKYTDDPSVARRWRAMTSARSRTSPEQREYLEKSFLKYVDDFLRSCGQSQNIDSLRSRISSIIKTAIEIRIAITEEVTSASLVICFPHRGREFNPSVMEDEEGDSETSQGLISCCSQVGLVREIARRIDDGSLRYQQDILLKPKVVLHSTLAAAVNE